MFFKYTFLCAFFQCYINCTQSYISYFFNTRYNIFWKPLCVTVVIPNPLLLIATQCPRVSLSHNLPLSSFTDGPASCIHGSATRNHPAVNIMVPGILWGWVKNSSKIYTWEWNCWEKFPQCTRRFLWLLANVQLWE